MYKTIYCVTVLTLLNYCGTPLVLAGDTHAKDFPIAGHPRIVTYRRIVVNETLPQLGARIYDQVDYELKLRRLNNDIKLTQVQLDNRRERADNYNKQFGRTSALLLTRQKAELAVLESELRLKELRKERQLSLKHRADYVHYRQLLLAKEAARISIDQ